MQVAPKYQKPVLIVPPPPKYQELTGNDQWKTAAPSDEVMKGNWWELFGDPQLSKLEEQVAVNNFNVKQLEAQFRQARATVLATSAGLDPSISAASGPASRSAQVT